MNAEVRVSKGRSMVTLGWSAFLVLLCAACALVFGYVVHGIFLVITSLPFFAVAFATTPLLTHVPAIGASRAAIVGSVLGWALSAPLGALVDGVTAASEGLGWSIAFHPITWVWALVPLAITFAVSWIHHAMKARHRD